MKIIISNGNFKFILGNAAEEAEKRNTLAAFITSGYPYESIIRILKILKINNLNVIRRFLYRKIYIPDRKIISHNFSEIFIQLSLIMRRLFGQNIFTDKIDYTAFKLYGFENRNIFEKIHGDIYHFRSAYGFNSVESARVKFITTLCDHSIAHPAVCDYLINNNGVLPNKNNIQEVSEYWKSALDDINQSDYCLVNSDFVKKTFINQGYDEKKIYVAYTGIDNEFLGVVKKRSLFFKNKKLNLIFVGDFSYRKGANILLLALLKLKNINWSLKIIGRVDPEIKKKYSNILNSENITLLGYIPRLQIAEELINSDAFVFPTLAEGSARVAFMAMLCGCYIITTENCGSVALDGLSGEIVDPGSVEGLVNSIRRLSSLQNIDLLSVGDYNSQLIREKYTQDNYGHNLNKIYEDILNRKYD